MRAPISAIRILTPLIAAAMIVAVRAQPTAAAAGIAPAGAELTLDQAIQQALAKNFAIKIESYSVPIAEAGVLEALGRFDPRFQGSYQSERDVIPQLNDPITGLPPAGPLVKTHSTELGLGGLLPWGLTYRLGASADNAVSVSNSFTNNYTAFAGLSVTQPLLRNFGLSPTLTTIRLARTNLATSEWEYRQAVMDTVTRVIFAYNELHYAHRVLASARRSRELADQLYKENERRFQVGAMSEFDVLTARSRVANREEGILFAERAVRVAGNTLKQLITDERTPALLDLPLAIAPPPPAPAVTVDAAKDFPGALKNRPDYQQAILAVQRGELNYRFQRNQLLPQVDLVGSYGYAGVGANLSDARGQVRDRDYRSRGAGVVVSVPIVSAAERGRRRSARLGLRQAEAGLQQLEQAIVVSVGNAATQIETTRKRVDTSRIARELSEQALGAEVKRLRAGTGITFFVLQQQEILSSVEVSEARAQADYRQALAEYDRQLGLTLEKHGITLAKAEP